MQITLNSLDDANMQVIKTCIKSFLDQAINDVANRADSDDDKIIKRYPSLDIISNNYISSSCLRTFKDVLDEFKIVIAMDESSFMYGRIFTISLTEFNGTILPYCISIADDGLS